MTKVELVAKLAEKIGETKKATTETVDALLEIIKDTLAGGEDITLTGYFTFKVKDVEARKARNPKSGATIDVPATKKVTVKVGTKIKDVVKGA